MEGLEKAGKLTGAQKTILGALTTTTSKLTDKAVEGLKGESKTDEKSSKSAVSMEVKTPTMQQDHTKTPPPNSVLKKDNASNSN